MAEGLVPVREGLLAREDVRAGETIGLRATRCDACDLTAFPARSTCEGCGAEVAAIELSTVARLSAQTEVIYPPPDAIVPVPYGVGLAVFPEGIAILGLLDEDLRERPEVGAAVETYAREVGQEGEGEVTYAFRRRPAPS